MRIPLRLRVNLRRGLLFMFALAVIFSSVPQNPSIADTGQQYAEVFTISKGETREHTFPFKQGEKYIVSVLDLQPGERPTHSVTCNFRGINFDTLDEFYSNLEWRVFSSATNSDEIIKCKNNDSSRSNAMIVVRMTPFSTATNFDSKDFGIPKDFVVIKKFRAKKNMLVGIAANNANRTKLNFDLLDRSTNCELYDDNGKWDTILNGGFGPYLEMFYSKKSAEYFMICEFRSKTDNSSNIRVDFFDTAETGKDTGKDLLMSRGTTKLFKFSAKKQQNINIGILKTQMRSTVGADVKYAVTDKSGKLVKVNNPRSSQIPDKMSFSFIPDYSGDFFLSLYNFDLVDAKIKFSGPIKMKELKSSGTFPKR